MMNLIQINQCHCNAILAYECCGLPWFRGVSQYSWSSPTQLEASENNLNAKRKCHIKHFNAPEIPNSKENSQFWHTETLAQDKTNAKRINSFRLIE